MDQINHCFQQLIRFSKVLAINNVDSNEKILQFGYNLGRLIVLLLKKGLVFSPHIPLSGYSMEMAISILGMDFLVGNEITEGKIADYGFAIGFIQEELGQSHYEWWKPISPLAANNEWGEVMAKIQQKLRSQKIEKKNCTGYISIFDDTVIDWNIVCSDISALYTQMYNK